MPATNRLTLVSITDETYPGDLGTTFKQHRFPTSLSMPQVRGTGLTAGLQDEVFTDTITATAAPVAIDLRGVLQAANGHIINFAEVTGFKIANLSEVSGETLIIGAGSNPFISWLNATGNAVVLGPGGIFAISSPLDGYATTAATADILTIDPGAATITFEIEILGRSA